MRFATILNNVFFLCWVCSLQAVQVGPNSGQVAGDFTNDASFGSQSWGTPSNAQTSNNSRSMASSVSDLAYSNYLKVLNLNFNIPSGNQIDGIQVLVEGKVGLAMIGFDIACASVRLVKGGTIQGNDQSDLGINSWSDAADGPFYFGGSTDKWGLSWLYSDINLSTFGVVVATGGTNSNAANTQIDYIGVTVWYSPAMAPTKLLEYTLALKEKKYNEGQEVRHYWETAPGQESLRFIVERQPIGESFSEIGSVDEPYKKGNTFQYTFTDPFPPSGIIYYRLKVLAENGDIMYSEIIEAQIIRPPPEGSFAFIGLYPNPVRNGLLNLVFEIKEVTEVPLKIALYGRWGEKVLEKDVGNLTGGIYTEQMDVSVLRSGVYLVRFGSGKGTRYARVLIE